MKRSLPGLISVVAAALIVTPAAPAAADSDCTAPQSAIFTPPAAVTACPGTVLACRRVALPEVPGDIAMSAWQIRHRPANLDPSEGFDPRSSVSA